ncbi:MAG: hypothetical protein ABSB76_11160 [Streptosporangiaceae bacterium]
MNELLAADPDVRLEIIDFISASGHAADAVELLESELNEVPDNDFRRRVVWHGY